MEKNDILQALSNADAQPMQMVMQIPSEIDNDLELCRITATSEIPARDFLFSLHGTPCFPRGEIVALTGKEKSGKTFFTSVLMTLCVSRACLAMERRSSERYRMLWYDTEQSEESTQEILCERITKLAGDDERHIADMFDIFNVRSLSWQRRLPMLEYAVTRHRPDLVIIDGIRDLVDDINDGVMSQEVLERLMRLATETMCCIVCVLHQNKSSEDRNLRGWIGTELSYKSFEVYECVKDSGRVFSCQQIRTRKYDITEKMQFTVNDQGLPVLCSYGAPEIAKPVTGERAQQKKEKQQGQQYFPPFPYINSKYVESRPYEPLRINTRLLFGDCMPEGVPMSARQLQETVMRAGNIQSPRFYESCKRRALDERVIMSAPPDSHGHVMYVRADDRAVQPQPSSASPSQSSPQSSPSLFSDS